MSGPADGLAPQALVRVLGVRSLLLGLAGMVLLAAALLVNNNLNEKDKRTQQTRTAVGDFSVNLTGRYDYRPPQKSDRTPVYLLTGGGIVCLALAVVCLPRSGGPPPGMT